MASVHPFDRVMDSFDGTVFGKSVADEVARMFEVDPDDDRLPVVKAAAEAAAALALVRLLSAVQLQASVDGPPVDEAWGALRQTITNLRYARAAVDVYPGLAAFWMDTILDSWDAATWDGDR